VTSKCALLLASISYLSTDNILIIIDGNFHFNFESWFKMSGLML